MDLPAMFSNFMTAITPAFLLTILSIVSFKLIVPKAYKKAIGKWDESAWYRIIAIFIVQMIIVLVIFNLFPSVKDLIPIKF